MGGLDLNYHKLLAVNYYAMQMAVHLKMTSVDDALENE